MKIFRRLMLTVLTGALALGARAQVERTVLFGVGGGNVLDTYITPYNYTGPSARLQMQTVRQARWGQGRVSTIGRYALVGGTAQSQASTARYYDGQLSLSGGWRYNWQVSPSLLLAAGGLMELQVGGTYSNRGGNNPGQVRAGADIAATLLAEYTFRVSKRQWRARLQLDAPLVGATFMPQYGQSYYQLFSLGHRAHNVCATWPGNAPSVRLEATLHIPVRKSQLVVGYGADVRQAHINGLKQHGWYNQFLIGFTRHLSLVP